MNGILFLYLPLSLGTDILMKVFSLLSLGEIWTISKRRDRQSIHHLVRCIVRSAHRHNGCGVLFICV